MIIDAHYHQAVVINEDAIADRAKHIFHAAKSVGRNIGWDAIRKASETWADPTGEHLIASMDQNGIDMTVVCTVDNMDSGKSFEEVRERNRIVGDITRRYPRRVIALAGVDPRRPRAADLVKQCLEEFGVSGLKYHPDHGYDPCGPRSYKLLEIVAEHQGVLLSHTGPLMPPARCALAEPMRLADIGVDFPEIKVIAAHMGALSWRSWAGLAGMQPNMYGDLAMWDLIAVKRYQFFRRELRDLIDTAGIENILFGSDAPIFSLVVPIREWIQILENLTDDADDGIVFTRDEVDAMLGGNAATVFGRPDAS